MGCIQTNTKKYKKIKKGHYTMRKILLIISCIFSVFQSYSQNSEQSARVIWETYQTDPSKMYTFIDGITNSDSPKDYLPYVQRFVKNCIERGIDWDVLYEEMKEAILPKDPDVATYFGVSLAQNATSYSNMIKALDALPKNHTIGNDFIEDAAIYPDGRIVIPIKQGGLSYGITISELFKDQYWPQMIQHFVYYRQMFLYQPKGNSMLGLLKYSGTKDDSSYTVTKAKENDKLELLVGIYLNKNGEKVGEKCMQYSSLAQARATEINTIKAEIKQSEAIIHQKDVAIKKNLIQKYGQKAYNAMNNHKPYIGMPEGIIRDYACALEDGYLNLYKFNRVEGGYKVYLPISRLKSVAKDAHCRIPRAIYCKGGKVAEVKW